MTRMKYTTFAASVCVLLAASIGSARQQDHQLSGIRGIPVEGHDNIAAIHIVGTKETLLSGSAGRKLHERLVANGADLRLGWPLESQTLCRFKEVVLDVMREKGFLDAQVSHEARPTYGSRRDLTLEFTIVEGKRSPRPAAAAPMLSPAERCMR